MHESFQPPFSWPASAIRVSHTHRRHIWTIRLLITFGLCVLTIYLLWLFQPRHQGEPRIFFWIFAGVFVFKALQWLYEWFAYFFIRFTPPLSAPAGLSVDVLTSYCPGEPKDMIYRTLKSITQITYPHKSYLCDESDDPDIRSMCATLGVTRLTRPDRMRGGKAGNINNAGLKNTFGDIVAILDPDHEPAPYFLDRVLGYFNDPHMGFVQTVQPYYNQKDSLIARGAAQQTYQFYGPVMLGMDGLGTVQTIGANCVFRRTALDSIEGHKDGTTEDRHTSMYLHAKGWKSVYVPEILTRGLVPTTLSAYYKQQLKWSYGCFNLLFTVYPKLFRKFTFAQKFYYGVSPLYYLYGIITFIDILIPIIALTFGFVPMYISLPEFLFMYIPLLLIVFLIRQSSQNALIEPENEAGLHLTGGLLRHGTWWVYILGFFYAIFGINVPYLPTPKGEGKVNEWKIALPNLTFMLLSLFAVAYGLYQDSNPYNFFMAGFASLNALVLGFNVIIGQQRFLERIIHIIDYIYIVFRRHLLRA